MKRTCSKLNELINAGWTIESLECLKAELEEWSEKKDQILANSTYEEDIKNLLISWGFSWDYEGTKRLFARIKHCLIIKATGYEMKPSAYLLVGENYKVMYPGSENSKVRYAVRNAFKNPTKEAEETFAIWFDREAFPTTKELIAIAVEKVLNSHRENNNLTLCTNV